METNIFTRKLDKKMGNKNGSGMIFNLAEEVVMFLFYIVVEKKNCKREYNIYMFAWMHVIVIHFFIYKMDYNP